MPRGPLDVLCQQLVGLAMAGAWTADDAFALIRRAVPYRALSRDDFDACLDYLSGRHRDGTAWLPSRLSWEGEWFTIADERTARLLRRNLGTILSEDPCAIRLQLDAGTGDDLPRSSLVGEVDEAYADRLVPGDRFMLDGRCLELRRRDGKDLFVDEVPGRPLVPRWAGATPPMALALAERLYLFRAEAAEVLRDGPAALAGWLRQGGLGASAAGAIARLIAGQESVSEVPDLGTLLIEGVAQQSHTEFVVHTPLPGPANEVLVRVLSRRLLARHGLRSVPLAANLGLLLVLERAPAVDADAWRALFDVEQFAAEFAAGLHESQLLRERFGQVAQTGLMVLRNPAGRKRKVGGKDWAARELFDQVQAADPEFVLLRQAAADVQASACDLDSALAFARRMPRLHVQLRWLAEPSPLGSQLLVSEAVAVEPPASRAEALADLQRDLFQTRAG
jgi:ATP-dependent Lhr-like helicase